MTEREPKTNCGLFTTANRVIVKAESEISALQLHTLKGSKTQEVNFSKITVAAYGRYTNDVELGDVLQIDMTTNPLRRRMKVADNNLSLKYVIDTFQSEYEKTDEVNKAKLIEEGVPSCNLDIKSVQENMKVLGVKQYTIVEYFTIDEIEILAITKGTNENKGLSE